MAACDQTRADAGAGPVAFEAVFRHVRSIQLEEPEGDPANLIVGVTSIAVAGDGRIAVVDRRSGRVRIYSGEDGALLASLGRFGRGPGEFRGAEDAAFDRAGRLYVVDVDNPRMTRYDRVLRLDTLVRVPGYFAYEVQPIAEDALLLTTTRGADEWLAIATPDGEVRAYFHPLDSAALAVPYWGSILAARAAVGAGSIHVLTNMLYPFYRYSLEGEPLGAWGSPPPSWVEPPRPERGQFVNQSIEAVNQWLRSFTVAAALGVYRDSLVLVVHGRHERFQAEPVHYALDVYDGRGAKLHADVPVPGQFLHAGEHIYFLVATPPEPWTIAVYSMGHASGS